MCDTCFNDFIVKCNDVITVYAQLEPLSTYTWIITDKFDRKYSHTFETDSDGFWQIDTIDLPEGLLTEYSGDFTLEVQDSSCKPIKFKVAQEYDCIGFHIKAGTFIKDSLGCDFTCTGITGTQTRAFVFTDQTDYTITWDAGLLAAYGNNPLVQVYHNIDADTLQLVTVDIEKVFVNGDLTQIIIHNAGIATGQVLIS